MKLRITIEQKTYDVDVELVEPFAMPSAASRVEGAPVASVSRPIAPPRPHSAPMQAASPPKPDATPQPPAAPWHGLTIGKSGELLAPVPGIVRELFVKVGDRVKAYEPLLTIEVSKIVAPQDKPLLGTLRATESGVIADITVAPGAAVAFGQQLLRYNP
jgi:biotin carboxyl carrier protein